MSLLMNFSSSEIGKLRIPTLPHFFGVDNCFRRGKKWIPYLVGQKTPAFCCPHRTEDHAFAAHLVL